MAESIMSISIMKLKEVLSQEQRLVRGAEDNIQSLIDELERTRPLLAADGDSAVKDRVISAAYDAEDAIDAYILKMKQRWGLPRWSSGGCTAGRLSKLYAVHNLGNQIDGIVKDIIVVTEEEEAGGSTSCSINSINARGGGTGGGPPLIMEKKIKAHQAPKVEEVVDVVGFDDDIKSLVIRLVEGGELRRSVISIIGMGGLGKTTLANKVYKHDKVADHFGCKAWVYVSRQFRMKELLLDIGECLWGSPARQSMEISMNDDEDALKVKIRDYLRDKRYLLVIDDVWRVEAWQGLRDALPDASNGSRVLLTTRLRDVAELVVDPTSPPPYELQLLGKEESWELLSKKAFPSNMRGKCPPDFDKVGREIAEKSGGLPLQIVVLGGLLFEKSMNLGEWTRVLKGVNWDLSVEDRTSRVLALSYLDLPTHLKSCFLYFTHYPEDTKISMRKLIRIWVAEGLIIRRSSSSREEMEIIIEQVAKDFLGELTRRCLIQVVEMNPNGDVRFFRIHNLLLELAVLEAKRERFSCVYGEDEGGDESLAKARRLSIQHSLGDDDGGGLTSYTSPELRSLLCFKVNREWQKIRPIFKGSKLLRVIDLEGVQINHLPNEVGEMVHLTYLGLRRTGLKELPSSIRRLQNLRTLDVGDTGVYVEIDTVEKMQDLRHLYALFAFLNKKKKKNNTCSVLTTGVLGRLTNLQTLSTVYSGKWIKEDLVKLTGLTRLKLRNREGEPLHEALPESIAKLHNLDRLTLVGDSIPNSICFSTNHPHLFALRLEGRLVKLPEFPSTLTKLTLMKSQLEQDDLLSVLEKLPNLRNLHLNARSHMGKKMVCSAGGFPRLQFLTLAQLQQLEEWTVEEGAMPNLHRLTIVACQNMKTLPDGLRHLGTLKEFELFYISSAFKDGVRRREGDEWDKIKHIPSLKIG